MAAPRDEAASLPVVEHGLIHHGKVFDIVADRVDLGGAAPVLREYTTHPGAVAVIALDDDDRVLLLSQYRHPVRHELWEPPAGLLDVPGEPWRSRLTLDEAVDLAFAAGFSQADATTPRDALPAALWDRTDALRPGGTSGFLHASSGSLL